MLLFLSILIVIGISPFTAMSFGQQKTSPTNYPSRTQIGQEDDLSWLPNSYVNFFSAGLQPLVRQYYGDNFNGVKESPFSNFGSHTDRSVSPFNSPNDEDWVKVATGDTLENEGYFGENIQGAGPKGKAKEEKKSWFSRFWSGRPNSGKPSDPANYGISPHGQYPMDSFQKNGVGNSNQEKPAILARVRQYFGRMLNNNPNQRMKHD